MTPLIKHLLETAMSAELEEHLEETRSKVKNRKNGGSKKRVKGSTEEFELITPRERNAILSQYQCHSSYRTIIQTTNTCAANRAKPNNNAFPREGSTLCRCNSTRSENRAYDSRSLSLLVIHTKTATTSKLSAVYTNNIFGYSSLLIHSSSEKIRGRPLCRATNRIGSSMAISWTCALIRHQNHRTM